MRWIFRGLGALLIVAMCAVAAFFLVPTERIAALVSQHLETSTGRRLTITGKLRPSLWPELGISTGAIALSNADWAQSGPMLEAESLIVGFDTAALWGGDIRITRINLQSPILRLERAKDGRSNWHFGDPAVQTSALDANGEPITRDFGLSLERAKVSDGQLVFIDHGSGGQSALNAIDATARLDDLYGAATLQIDARHNGQAVTADGTLGALATFLTDGATPTVASATIGRSTFQFDGRAGLSPLAAAGAVDLDLQDLAALFALVGGQAPDLPYGLGQQSRIVGNATFTDAGITLRDAKIHLDHNLLLGGLDASLAGPRPKITARLSGGDLDFSAAVPKPGGSEGGEGQTSSGWSKDHIDVSALSTFDADVAFAANSVDLGVLKLGATQTRTTLDRGRAVTELHQLSAYGGALTGSFVVNARGGLSSRATITGTDLSLQGLLSDLAGYDRLIAIGSGRVNVLAIGDTMDALMRSLDGHASLQLGTGEYLGLDLVGMIRNLDPSFLGAGQKTIFDAASAQFAFGDGVMRTQDLFVDARLVQATGQGSADLGAQTLAFNLRNEVLDNRLVGGLAVPLIITGPWASPSVRLDLEAIALEELADEIEAVKAKAETVLLDKLEEETGIQVDTLGEVEGALKDSVSNRVEEALGAEIGNALGGLLNR